MTEAVSGPDETSDLSPVVAAASRGDREAFRTLYRGVQPGLLRYLRAIVGDDAEDVAAETWLQVVRDIDAFSGDGDGFRGWVATIGRNRALDHLRRFRRRPLVVDAAEILDEFAGDDDTAAEAVRAVSTDAAIALIATLPPDQAEAVLLRVVLDLDSETAAKVLGKRSGAVRMAASRGLKRLAERLRERSAERLRERSAERLRECDAEQRRHRGAERHRERRAEPRPEVNVRKAPP